MTPMLSPDDPRAPKYWMYETGGQLVPAVQRYLQSQALSAHDVRWIRAYLRQWIDSPVWDPNADDDSRGTLADLRSDVARIQSQSDIEEWIDRAVDLGIDPL